MNRYLQQYGRQLAGTWKQLGLNQRISVVLAALVVLAVVLSLVFWSSRVDYSLLYGKLDDVEAGKVIAVLDEQKIPHRTGQGGGSIYVPRDKVHLVRMQLASKGLPRGEGVGFEIFDKQNFGISDFVQRANYLRAVQGELARTINQLDEIEAARVMIVMPENRLLVDNQKKATASVFVRTKGQAQLPPTAVNSIRFLVANSVESLQPNQVTVVDNRGNVLSDNTESDSLAGLSSTQLAARRNLEQYLAKKAEGMLEAVLGPGQAVVRVAAEINFDQLTRTEEKYDPESQVMRTSTINDESTDATTPGSSGTPGISSNLGYDTNTLASNPSNKTKKKVTNSQYEINRITSYLTQAAGGMKRVSAAVFVAARTEGAGDTRKIVPRSKEELEKLRRIVQSALGAQTGTGTDETLRDTITLEEMPFNEPLLEVKQALLSSEKKQYWFTQVQNLIYPVLALAVLVLFWRALKRTPMESLPVPALPAQLNGENGHGAGSPAYQQGIVTVDVFNRLVRENPENVNQALQQWLNRGTTNHLNRS
jgi:flagellar M-ring protein FliF